MYPKEIAADLDIAKARSILKLKKHGTVRLSYCTIKYTAKLVFTVNVTHPFDFQSVITFLCILRQTLNTVKKTPVTAFSEIKICNIHGSGTYNSERNRLKDCISLPFGYQLQIGHHSHEPATPCNVNNIHGNFQYSFFNIVERSGSNLIKVNHTGSFTVIANSIEQYKNLYHIVHSMV